MDRTQSSTQSKRPRLAAIACAIVGCIMNGCAAAKTAPPPDAGAIRSVENPDAPATAGASAAAPSNVTQPPQRPAADCAAEGCSCSEPGATRACWTGPVERRGTGECHDGQQTCNAQGAEFTTWGPCEGQQLDCGIVDAGTPTDCGCIPGSMVACDEDCSASIFCSATAAKTCLPDGTWSACRETVDNSAAQAAEAAFFGDAGIASVIGQDNPGVCAFATTGDISGISVSVAGLSISGLTCRNVYHGCCSTKMAGMYMGDCDKLFTCGHAPK